MIHKIIAKEFLGYYPVTNQTKWHIVALFDDGTTRQAILFLRDENPTGKEPGWREVGVIP